MHDGNGVRVGMMVWKVFFVEEADSGEEVGVQADGGQKEEGGQRSVWRWFEFCKEDES